MLIVHCGDQKRRLLFSQIDMTKQREYRLYILVSAVSCILYGCRKPYSPRTIAGNNNYLVVEGIITAGQDLTIIKLSRTVNVPDFWK